MTESLSLLILFMIEFGFELFDFTHFIKPECHLLKPMFFLSILMFNSKPLLKCEFFKGKLATGFFAIELVYN